jgi:hypothetical protein
MDTVDAELATEDLTKTDADAADLYVGYQAGIGTEKQFTSYNADWDTARVGTGEGGAEVEAE